MTAEELLHLPRGHARHELIAGELIAKSLGGALRGLVAARIGVSLGNHVRRYQLGVTSSSAGFQIGWNPDTVLGVPVAFVTAARHVHTWGYFQGAPDLAIDLVNFDETFAELERRATEWLSAGARMAIVIDPVNEIASVWTPRSTTRLTIDDTISGGDVVPGWSLPLRELFA